MSNKRNKYIITNHLPIKKMFIECLKKSSYQRMWPTDE